MGNGRSLPSRGVHNVTFYYGRSSMDTSIHIIRGHSVRWTSNNRLVIRSAQKPNLFRDTTFIMVAHEVPASEASFIDQAIPAIAVYRFERCGIMYEPTYVPPGALEVRARLRFPGGPSRRGSSREDALGSRTPWVVAGGAGGGGRQLSLACALHPLPPLESRGGAPIPRITTPKPLGVWVKLGTGAARRNLSA